MGITGVIKASVFEMRSPKSQALEREIEAYLRQPVKNRSVYLSMLAELQRFFQVREYAVTNLIAITGRAAMMKRLANITTYTGIINYGTLGTGTNAALAANTQLQPEVFRKIVADAAVD